jgi:hypothetical protein
MKLYHLSHTDLDGYGCQLLSSIAFKDISFYNSNYGNEIDAKLSQIIEDVKNSSSKDNFILVTDLNLNTNQSNFISQKADELGAKLQLLDHHITGEEQSNIFDWYYLDVNRCATLITFDFLKEEFEFKFDNETESLVKHINAVDLWLKDTDEFEFAKVLMRLINETKEINKFLFPRESVDYKIDALKQSISYLNINNKNFKNRHIELDNDIHFIKKGFLSQDGVDNTLENLVARNVVLLLNKKKNEFTIHYKHYKGILVSNIGNVSIIGNEFLVENPDYDFFLDVTGKGNAGIRANGKCDVSLMAKELFGGGGHKNASGGRINGYKEFFNYNDLKTFIQQYINSKKL